MKKIFRVHPLTYVMALLAVLTANFKLYLIFMLSIVIHELGHILAGLYFHWHLKEIVVLPLGMISKYDELINRPIIEELTIASAGVILEIVIYLLLFRGYPYFYWSNLIIIVFNLLPVYPLDGSKLLNILLNKICSFKHSYIITINLSFLFTLIIFVVCIIHKDLLLIIIFLPLLINLIKGYPSIPSVINKFYLERYLYHLSFEKIKYINGMDISKMKRDCYHYFKDKNKVYTEYEILKKVFDKP